MKKLSFLAIVVLLAFLITSCTPTPTPSPTPTPTTTPPTGTTAPVVNIVRDGGWTGKIIQNGDPVRFNRDVVFQGTAPSSSVIKIYRDNTLVDQISANPAGEFNWFWNSMATETTYNFYFTATQGSLGESTKTPFVIVVDGTKPYIQSLSAKADTQFGSAPTITVNFNEEVEVLDMNAFTLPAVWAFSCVICPVPPPSTFNTFQVALNADKKSVTLTGTWATDHLDAGDQIAVTFLYVPLMGVTDKAGNPFNSTLNIATGVVTP
jgi:hypothetical protein